MALTLTFSIEPTKTINANYAALELVPNTEIKLINESVGPLQYGFGPDIASFAASQTVAANSQKRLTANMLGFDALINNKLNIRNQEGITLACKLEFYLM